MNRFIVLFLSSISVLQILQMATVLLAIVPSSVPEKPKHSHTTLFKVLLGTIHKLKAAIFTTLLTHAWPATAIY